MSVQTQIDRIITAVDAAHAKVAEKGGTTTRPYLVGNLADAIDTIPTGTQIPTLTNPGTASDALSGKEFIDGSGNKVTGTIATKTASNLTASGKTVTVPAGYYASQATKSVATATQATPSIEVSSAGLITAKATQSAGYVAAGTKSATKQLSTQGAQTITPGTADKTIASGKYLTGAQTIKGDANLLPANIKSGVSIFGVAGTLEAGSGGSSGGSLETCTVSINDGGLTYAILYTALRNGQVEGVALFHSDFTHGCIETTLTDIVKGSVIFYIAGDIPDFDINGSAEVLGVLGNYKDISGYYSIAVRVDGDATIFG